MIIVCMFMILMHILEDFHLQGIMADMKQFKWWGEQCDRLESYGLWTPTGEKCAKDYRARCRNDYRVALALHGFEWSMFVHIPLMALYAYLYGFHLLDMMWLWFSLAILVQCSVPSFVDDLKANRLRLNLVEDQLIHLAQIGASCVVFGVMM